MKKIIAWALIVFVVTAAFGYLYYQEVDHQNGDEFLFPGSKRFLTVEGANAKATIGSMSPFTIVSVDNPNITITGKEIKPPLGSQARIHYLIEVNNFSGNWEIYELQTLSIIVTDADVIRTRFDQSQLGWYLLSLCGGGIVVFLTGLFIWFVN